MDSRKRVLVLTPRYPYPVIGGDRVRIYEICRELARQNDLTLLSLCDTQAELHATLPNDGVFQHIERVYLPKWRSAVNVLSAFPGTTPLQVAYYRSGKFARRVRELLPMHEICLAHLIRAGEYIRSIDRPKVLEMTDAISLNYQRVRKLGKLSQAKALIYILEAKRLLKYEQSIINDFDLVTLVSHYDREFLLQGRDVDHVIVCSNGVNLETLPYRERRCSERVIVFIGNMMSLQNLDACHYFIEEVLPLLRRHFDCRFRAIGRITAKNAARLARYEGVEVLSNVPRVADAVGDAIVGVAPIRIGAGIQNKILEYMALGLPAITSSIGLEGLDAVPGKEILLADKPEEYVEHIGRILQDKEYAIDLARAAYAYVKRAHNWSTRLAPLVQWVSRITGKQ